MKHRGAEQLQRLGEHRAVEHEGSAVLLPLVVWQSGGALYKHHLPANWPTDNGDWIVSFSAASWSPG